MANTTWNGADLLNVTLSGTNNLTATRSGAGAGGVRTFPFPATGSYYFEFTCTTWPSNVIVGVANIWADLTQSGGTTIAIVGSAGVYSTTGAIWINGVASAAVLGNRANGNIIGVALNVDSGLIWFRVAPSGNWNGSASANPATGTGGLPIGALFKTATTLCGVYAHNGSVASAITGNFGDTAFSGAVPASFTAGLPAAGAPNALISQVVVEQWGGGGAAQISQIALEEWGRVQPSQLNVTQTAIEEWGTDASPQVWVTQTMLEEWGPVVPPALQVTQTALEHWGSVTTGTPTRLQVTQAALEHWGSVASFAPPRGLAYVLSPSSAHYGATISMRTATRNFLIPLAAVLSETPITAPATIYAVSPGRAGIGAALVQETATGSYVLALPAVLTEGGIAAPSGPGSVSVNLVGVAATGAAGTLGLIIPRVAYPAGVYATGMAGAINAYPGPVAFPAGVYATGMAEPVFALAGGVVKKFVFFMGGVF